MQERAALDGEEKVALKSSIAAAEESRRREVELKADQLRAEEATTTYLRNVILRYMQSEDHEAMFPVVAMVLKLGADEVADIRERRERRERESRGAVRRLIFG